MALNKWSKLGDSFLSVY